MSKFPKNWAGVKLSELALDPKSDIVDGPFGSRLKASEYVDEGIPIARLQNIKRNAFLHKNIRFVSAEKAEEIARHHFVSGDLLVSKLGDPLGKACIAPESLEYGILVADVVRIRPNKNTVDNKFLMYAINSDHVIQQFKRETKGTTRPRVNLTKIRNLDIPLAPLPEQRRIVARIEELFSRLDAGVAALRHAKAQLQRYRQSILSSAFAGGLVLQDPTDEPASTLLERIEEELANTPKKKRPRTKRPASNKQNKTTDMKSLIEVLSSHQDWISAQQAFSEAGVTTGSDTDSVEKIYEELSQSIDRVDVQRRDHEDWLRLISNSKGD